MKKIVSLMLFCALTVMLQAQTTHLRLMPQWVPQAQFAGYYIAFEKGFFAQEGLDVEIVNINSVGNKSAIDCLSEGSVDVITEDCLEMLCRKASGIDVVNVLQTSQQSALRIVSSIPVKSLRDLAWRKVARWKYSYATTFNMLEHEAGVQISWIPVQSGVMPFIYGAVDAITVMSYNEYYQIMSFRGEVPDDNVLNLEKCEYACIFPEDGMYLKSDYARAHPEVVEKLVRAVKRGWEYAAANREETVGIVMEYVKNSDSPTNHVHQKYMLDEILRLQLDPVTGERSFAPVSRDKFNRMVTISTKYGILPCSVEYDNFFYHD